VTNKNFKLSCSYGYRTWEWNPEAPLRSPIYHSQISLIYKALQLTGLDSYFMRAYSPYLIGVLYAAVFDLFFLKIGTLLVHPDLVLWVVMLSLFLKNHSSLQTTAVIPYWLTCLEILSTLSSSLCLLPPSITGANISQIKKQRKEKVALYKERKNLLSVGACPRFKSPNRACCLNFYLLAESIHNPEIMKTKLADSLHLS